MSRFAEGTEDFKDFYKHFEIIVTLIILWTEKWLVFAWKLKTKNIYVAKILKKNLWNEGTTIIDHPPYSPELTP